MTTKNRPEPFTNTTYLDAEIEHLRLRLHRIELEHRLADAERAATESASGPRGRGPGIPELRGTLCEVSRREQQARDEIHAHLEVRRADPNVPELGLDRLCMEYDLGAQERLLILGLLVPAISKSLADHVCFEVGGFCGRLSVADLCFVLNPQSVEGWLQARRCFRPDAPLIKSGLVAVDTYGAVTAETLMNANVELSLKAFSIILSDPEALSEVPADEDE